MIVTSVLLLVVISIPLFQCCLISAGQRTRTSLWASPTWTALLSRIDLRRGAPQRRYKSLANKTNRARQPIVADYYIRFYSLGGALHVHWQSERHQRGSRQLNPHNLPAVH